MINSGNITVKCLSLVNANMNRTDFYNFKILIYCVQCKIMKTYIYIHYAGDQLKRHSVIMYQLCEDSYKKCSIYISTEETYNWWCLTINWCFYGSYVKGHLSWCICRSTKRANIITYLECHLYIIYKTVTFKMNNFVLSKLTTIYLFYLYTFIWYVLAIKHKTYCVTFQ